MKLFLSSVFLAAVCLGTDGKRIPSSLSKAAFEATKITPELRRLETRRLRDLKARVAQAKSKQRVTKEATKEDRDLGNYAYNANYNAYDGNGGYYNNQGNGYGNGGYYNQYAANEEAEEQANQDDGDWSAWNYDGDYNLNENMDNEAVGFDITEYSFHYTGCSAIKTYSDDLAEDEDSDTVLMASRMATFRLCPTDQCSSNSYDGCNSNYGEYVLPMDEFILGMLSLQEDRVYSYCTYCQECADKEAFNRFYQELEYHKENIITNSEAAYENWVANYGAQYVNDDANNGDDDANDNYLAQMYYKKLMSGNYANNYVYGQNGYKSSGNGYQYQSQQDKYNNNYQNGNANGNGYQNNGYNNGYNAYNNGYNNGNNGAYGANGNGENNGYYGYQNANGYNNQYAQNQGDYEYNNYANDDMAQQWQTWNSFNMNKYKNEGGEGQVYSAQQGWSNLGAWYGNKIVNGQFNNGVFQEGWGFIGADGNFYSLENDDIIQNWDADMYGYELPDGWDQYLGQGEQESCSYESAGSCYNQFVACMQILGEDEYEDYAQEVAEEVYGDMYEMYERNQATLQDFMECTEIDFDGDYEGDDKQQDEQQGQNNGGYYNGNWQANGNANYEQYKNDDGDYSFYVGPHCDGDKITLAVYTDEYCSNYASGVDIEDILGYDPMQGMDGEEFELVPTDCISCAYDESNVQNQPWYEGEEVDGAEDGINPMCSILYQFSGKCNKNLKPETIYSNAFYYQQNGGEVNEDWLQMYQSENQYLNEDTVCAYIDSLKLNTYDEYGEVILDQSMSWRPSEWSKEVRITRRAMSSGMKAGLVVTSLAAAAMAVWACVLHGMLARKNIPWRPKRNPENAGEDPTDLARQNSGIVMGRSRSGAANTPLI